MSGRAKNLEYTLDETKKSEKMVNNFIFLFFIWAVTIRRTSHTSCFGGFWSPGGSVVEGSWTALKLESDVGESGCAVLGGMLPMSMITFCN